MFTGIITNFGSVCDAERMPDHGMKIHIKTNAQGIALGDSVACDGVCLTASKLIAADVYEFHVSQETLSLTTIQSYIVICYKVLY